MKLGDVLKKERERCGLSADRTAECLHLHPEQYADVERGESQAEIWGPRIALLAIRFGVPMARLLSPTGRVAGGAEAKVGDLLARYRAQHGDAQALIAEQLGISADEYCAVEAGASPVEGIAPWLLRFAELVDQPVFNLFYPCGLPLEQVDDYP